MVVLKKNGIFIVNSKTYVAYGSNLNLKQMENRCPTAKVIGTGFVKGYELLFRGKNGRAVATIEPNPINDVPVVLWKIDSEAEHILDVYEGYPILYRKEDISVSLDNGQDIEAMVYLINYGRIASPSKYYYNVIYKGYLDNNIDLSYLKVAATKCNTK